MSTMRIPVTTVRPAVTGFGELSITGPPIGLKPVDVSGSAGAWGVAGTTDEVTAARAAGPKQNAGVVAYGGKGVIALAAEINPDDATGTVASIVAQGAQTGLNAQTGSGIGVLSVCGAGGTAVMGEATGGWAAQFSGNVLCKNGTLTAGATTLNGDLNVVGTVSVKGSPLVDSRTQVAALTATVNTLQTSVNALASQVSTLQQQVKALQAQTGAIPVLQADVSQLTINLGKLQEQVNDL